MKILELRFKNLNSLYGEWRIDFRHPDYVSNGIFALIGPTGAGKSTVLDAICLALYGATPRLGKITQSSNELMSRQMGECYAEVVFQTHDGQYRAHWQQRRARKQVDGALQAPVHEIINHDNGQILESKKSFVANVIAEKTGMDFERFTRAILLAQGGFDTFLKADVEQKSTILEQITGTEIYSDISKKVYARKEEEKQQLAILQAKAEGMELLSNEEEQSLREQQTTLVEQLNTLNAQSLALNKEKQWLSDIDKLEQSLAKLAAEKIALEKAQLAFAPTKARLERGMQAASIEAVYGVYVQLRHQQQKDETTLQALQATLPELNASLQQAAQILADKKANLAAHKQTLLEQQTVLKAVRALDVILQERKASLQQLEQEMSHHTTLMSHQQAKMDTLKDEQSAFTKAITVITQYEQDYAQDANLLSDFGAITALYEDWRARLAEMHTAQAAYEEKRQAFVDQQAQRLSSEDLSQTQQHLQRADKALAEKIAQKEALLGGQTLKTIREQIAQLQSQAQQKAVIVSLAEQRQALRDGKPCPLCGATEHPYNDGVDVGEAADGIEVRLRTLQAKVQQIDTLSEAIATLQTKRFAAQRLHDQFVQQQLQQETQLTHLADTLGERQATLGDFEKRAQEKEQALVAKMAVYGLGVSEKDRQKLAERLTQWQDNTARKQQLIQDEQRISQQRQHLSDQNALNAKTLAKYERTVRQWQNQYQAKLNERRALLGDESADEVEDRLQQAVEQAQAKYDKQAECVQDCRYVLQQTQQQIQDKQQQLNENASILADKKQVFAHKLAQKSFADEAEFLQARLPENELEALNEKAQALSEQQATLQAQQQYQQAQLATLRTHALTTQSYTQLEQQLAILMTQIEDVNAKQHKISYQLETNDQAKAALTSHYHAIEKQRIEYQRWHELNELIGSSDGKKYRSFAQGLTFEVMIGHANRQLSKMSDRYRLLRHTHSPLTLNVVDFYQADAIRSVKNLSGGESFIVSLALALGLSSMASRNVQIDSLFLDEGFGTLDEHALDTALTMLSELQQDGKLIGIISHVGALKERIATQINVTPVSNGKSHLQGPGCAQL